jgi:hypothetical protein
MPITAVDRTLLRKVTLYAGAIEGVSGSCSSRAFPKRAHRPRRLKGDGFSDGDGRAELKGFARSKASSGGAAPCALLSQR